MPMNAYEAGLNLTKFEGLSQSLAYLVRTISHYMLTSQTVINKICARSRKAEYSFWCGGTVMMGDGT